VRLSKERLQSEAAATDFRAELLEKVLQLLALLERLRDHPFLAGRWALKGGTALNLFYFALPRLSVDIDLNYVGAADRATMLAERPRVEQALRAACAREGLAVTRMPAEDHAGGKWRLRYAGALGQNGTIEVDLNYLLRVPLWPVGRRDAARVGSFGAAAIPVLDLHELAAGKLAALLSRHAARDLFDAHRLLTATPLDPERLRLAFVVYGGLNRKDWRTVAPDDVAFTRRELEEQLVPVLRTAFLREVGQDADWAARLVAECRAGLSAVLPFTAAERAFLDRLLDRGEVAPELLTRDAQLVERIRANPGLQWKALNVRGHRRT
jgi:predicted nucleotidyltransferase component of viral defense system